MKKNKKAFSLIIAIGLVMASIMVAYIIMEYMIPFLRNIKGIENSTSAYYLAYSGLENGLYFFSTRSGSLERNEILENNYSGNYNVDYGYEYQTFSSGTTLPKSGAGNSEYDQNYDTISMGNPIQLSVGYNYISTISDLEVYFKVPDLDNLPLSEENIEGNDINVINWQLSSEDATLNSLPETLIKSNIINSGEGVKLGGKRGRLIDGTEELFSAFFDKNCKNNNRCILRFSVINPLKLSGTNTNIPYLEWKIDSSPSSIPLRYSIIESTGKSYGFNKTLEIKVPQDTVPEALDFTVFQ